MKKIIIITVCMVIAFVLCVHIVTKYFTTEILKEQNKYKAEIGKKFILDKDTLTIVDYSSFMKTFKLSNGKEVSATLIIKN